MYVEVTARCFPVLFAILWNNETLISNLSYFITYYGLKSLNKTEQTFHNLFCCEHATVMGGNELAQSLLGFIHALITNKALWERILGRRRC